MLVSGGDTALHVAANWGKVMLCERMFICMHIVFVHTLFSLPKIAVIVGGGHAVVETWSKRARSE
jgi:hypothetical protein